MRYRTIDVRMHGDEKYRALSRAQPNGQTLWVYLLTGEHTTILPGLSRVGEQALAESLEWPLPALRRCWGEIEAQGMARADWAARVLWVPNRIRYPGNGARNPNMVKSWRAEWDEVPECALKMEAWETFAEYMRGRDQVLGARVALELAAKPKRGKKEAPPPARLGFLEAFEKACPKPALRPSPNGSGNGLANHSPNGSGNGLANHSPNGSSNHLANIGAGAGAGAGEEECREEGGREGDPGEGQRPTLVQLVRPETKAGSRRESEHGRQAKEPRSRREQLELALHQTFELVRGGKYRPDRGDSRALETLLEVKEEDALGRWQAALAAPRPFEADTIAQLVVPRIWNHFAGARRRASRAPRFVRVGPENSSPLWAAVLERCRASLRQDLVERWFAPLRARQEAQELILAAPDPFHANFFGDQYLSFVEQVALEVHGVAVTVRIGVEHEGPRTAGEGAA